MRRSGWLTFSAVVLITAGIMRIFDAIWAFRYKGSVVDNLNQALFGHSLTTYGWIWLIVGAILIVSGLFLMMQTGVGHQIARWVGIVAAVLGAITAATWLPYYPVWTLIYIALGGAVVYGLTTHFDGESESSRAA